MGGSRPRLLVLTSTYPRWAGDPEPGFVHELARRLVGRFQVTVVCPHAVGAATREDMDGVHVVRYRYAPERWETLVNDGGIVANLRRNRWKLLLLPGFLLGQLLTAWRILRTSGADVMHAHWLVPQGVVAALLRLASGRRVPFVVTSHGADLYALKGRFWQMVKRTVANAAACTTVVSQAMAERVHELGVPPGQVTVQSMGVDVSETFTQGDGPRRRSMILFVGRLVEKKGVRHLLDAMPGVLRQRPDVELCVVGFGPEEAALRERARQLGLGECVRFAGAVRQADLPGLYRQAALFVAPFVEATGGDQEGLGLVLVEAIGCGCPVLVGRVPAVADVMGPGYEDLIVDPADTEAFAKRILEALNDPVRLQDRMGTLRRDLATRFDWASVAARYGDLLAMIGRGGRRA